MEQSPANLVEQTLVYLARRASEMNLGEYLLIGGNAVIANGVPRATRDIDLAIPDRTRDDWREFLESEGFPFIHGTDAFVQFQDTTNLRPRVDLMIVDETTWQILAAKAWVYVLTETVSTAVASAEHLIAMKLRACQSAHRRHDALDWSDILELALRHGLDPEKDPQFSDLVLRFGDTTLHARLIHDLRERRPDATDQDNSRRS